MPTINLRLTDEEHAALKAWAHDGRRSIQKEIIWRLFTEPEIPGPRLGTSFYPPDVPPPERKDPSAYMGRDKFGRKWPAEALENPNGDYLEPSDYGEPGL